MTDYYKILGLSKNCSDEEIKKAYKKLALKWHPDKNRGNEPEAQKKFQEIAKAYSVLSDPEKRKHYDITGTESQLYPEYDKNSSFHFTGSFPQGRFAEDIFRDVFGTTNPFDIGDDDFSQFHHMPRKRIKTIEHEIKCSLEELYNGTNKKLKIDGNEINVEIMAGWKEGTKITYDHINNHKIVLVVKQKHHPLFVREGNDLVTTITINNEEAVNGIIRQITLLNKSIENIMLNGIPSSNYAHVLKGKGMPIRTNGNVIGYGNLYIYFIVKFC